MSTTSSLAPTLLVRVEAEMGLGPNGKGTQTKDSITDCLSDSDDDDSPIMTRRQYNENTVRAERLLDQLVVGLINNPGLQKDDDVISIRALEIINNIARAHKAHDVTLNAEQVVSIAKQILVDSKITPKRKPPLSSQSDAPEPTTTYSASANVLMAVEKAMGCGPLIEANDDPLDEFSDIPVPSVVDCLADVDPPHIMDERNFNITSVYAERLLNQLAIESAGFDTLQADNHVINGMAAKVAQKVAKAWGQAPPLSTDQVISLAREVIAKHLVTQDAAQADHTGRVDLKRQAPPEHKR